MLVLRFCAKKAGQKCEEVRKQILFSLCYILLVTKSYRKTKGGNTK